MRIVMRRKVNLGNYDNADFEIELEGDDLEAMRLKAYKEVLKFEVLHGEKTMKQSVDAMLKFRKLYKYDEDDE